MMVGVVQRQQWDAQHCGDLAAGWEVLCSGPVDLLLLDLQLPDGEGTDLLRKLRRSAAPALPDPKTPVLVISSRAQLQTRLAALDLGADGYVIKPVHLEEVAAVMRALLRRRATLQAGQIRHQDRPSREHFRYLVQLPRKFHEGETHEYTVRLRLPAGQPMAPHYVLQPLLPVKSFGVKVRFDLARLPSSIWRLNGVPPRMIDVDHDERELLRADRFGELQLEFRNLRQGFAYGLSWA
jgi:CheY-like chemotaxis protein